MLAAKCAETAECPDNADAFDLRTLRALGIVLLESFKKQLKEYAVDANIVDRLALSSHPDADVSVSGSDPEVFRRRRKDQPDPNSVKRKRKQTQDR